MPVNEQTDNGERDEMDLLGDHEENLAERLSKMVIENELEDPAIMRAVQTRPALQVSYSDSRIEAYPCCFISSGVMTGLRCSIHNSKCSFL